MKFLKIMDYRGEETETQIDIDNLDDIYVISIEVVSGDEICTVFYTNGNIETYDSSCYRTMNFDDKKYEIYNKLKGINIIYKFIERKDSYWNLWEV